MRPFYALSGGSRRLARAAWPAGVALFATVLPHAAHAADAAAKANGNTSAAADEAPADAAPAEELPNIIVVTARNKAEQIVDVPIPISVLSSATIEQQHVNTLADVTQRAP